MGTQIYADKNRFFKAVTPYFGQKDNQICVYLRRSVYKILNSELRLLRTTHYAKWSYAVRSA